MDCHRFQPSCTRQLKNLHPWGRSNNAFDEIELFHCSSSAPNSHRIHYNELNLSIKLWIKFSLPSKLSCSNSNNEVFPIEVSILIRFKCCRCQNYCCCRWSWQNISLFANNATLDERQGEKVGKIPIECIKVSFMFEEIKIKTESHFP